MTDQEKRWMAIGQAVERACAELPEGFDLHLELERDAGTVRLYLPDTDASEQDFEGDTLSMTIHTAINYAIDLGSASALEGETIRDQSKGGD
ncbi:hypothetical protein HH212_00165 [Massilia forsythiae]|uniref:Uncharacterized protein n=1 Tax=Massilia forsythiae TaxID=2728020 RepID=A0A7Z2VSH3_9BURK|nr:hypothetical protein [Massilia forsythiae]QJD98650.1 hypothetical protein HH212_00165 [Massilia forsythiae]